jgi:hypothetical protein
MNYFYVLFNSQFSRGAKELFIQATSFALILSITLSLTALATLSGCNDDEGETESGTARSAQKPQAQSKRIQLREIRVGDGVIEGASFEVSLDGVVVGITPPGGESTWTKSVQPGSHSLTVRSLGGASQTARPFVQTYSNPNEPMSFPEPQAASHECEFSYEEGADGAMTNLGKNFAECSFPTGGSLSFQVEVSPDR